MYGFLSLVKLYFESDTKKVGSNASASAQPISKAIDVGSQGVSICDACSRACTV